MIFGNYAGMPAVDKLRSIHPEDILMGIEEPSSLDNHVFSGSVFPELSTYNGDVLVISASPVEGPNGFNLFNTPVEKIKDFLVNNSTDQTKILIEDWHEGIRITEVYGIITKIVNTSSLQLNQFSYASCTANSDEIQKLLFYSKIHTYAYNTWEQIVHKNSLYLPNLPFEIKRRQKLFLCFNRMLRPHRLHLLALLFAEDLVDQGFYSFFLSSFHDFTISSVEEVTHWINCTPHNPELHHISIREIAKHFDSFPLILNIEHSNNKNFIDKDDFRLYSESYFSLVTETSFFKNYHNTHTVFFSEKTYKPILMKHPFILVGAWKSLWHLKKQGYKTFSPFIDESYDEIEDDFERLFAITREVVRLSKFTDAHWILWQHSIKSIVEHNYQTLISKKDDNDYIISRPNAS